MKKLLALLLALTMVLTLAACGKNDNKNDGAANGGNTTVNNEQDAANQPETPDEEETDAPAEPETPDEETEPTEPEVPAEPETPETEAPAEPQLTVSHTDVTFKAAGSSFQLSVEGTEETVTFTSADETIAAVAEDGTVTAVAPGTTKITAAVGDVTFECIIRCNWKDEAAGTGVDLKAFIADVLANYTISMGMTEMTEADLIDNYFAGLSDISLKQQALYYTMFSMNNGEISAVEVANASDVETVKAIFQARVDYMANGGAWYPEPTEIWTNSSRIVSCGNYVLMVAARDCDSIVADFEALVG